MLIFSIYLILALVNFHIGSFENHVEKSETDLKEADSISKVKNVLHSYIDKNKLSK